MIHQIADENGTLKHIILSVMDANEDGSQPLDSTVITLPQGTFRIDSNGELVSTSTGERGTSAEAGGGPTPLTTLPQQAYFANYDGCPPNSYEASLSDNIDPSTGGKPQSGAPVDRSSSNYQESDATNSETLSSNEKVTITGTVAEQGSSNKKTHQSSNSTTTNKTSGNSTSTSVASNHKTSPTGKQVTSSKVTSNHHTINGTVKEGGAQQQQISANVTDYGQNNTDEAVNSGGPKEELSSTDAQQQAEQVVLPAPSDVAPYPAPHQVMANEMDMLGSGLAPIMSTVDGQLYGYPACCCCCYCDPTQEAARVDQPLVGVPGQQDVAGLVALPPGGQPQATADQVSANVPGRANCRALAANNLNQTTNSPVMAYPNPMLAGGRPPAMQAGLGVPIALATGAPLTQPIVGQNGIVPVPSGAHMAADCNTTAISKVHPGSGKCGRNGYKQLKMVPVSGSQTTGTDRAQQSAYGSGYTSQGGHKTYNSIVSSHHNHSHHNSNHHHHNHHHQQQQQQHYHQPNSDGSSAVPASASMSTFKNQALMANSHQSSVAGGSYSSSPVYSSYNHVPTATLTNVVSSNSNKASQQSGQMGNGGAPAYGSNSHKQQQQLAPANGPANYQHGGRSGPNSDSNYMQRTSRDHVSTYSHSNTNNNSAGGYVQTNLRQMSQQQHNNENKTRQGQLSDKSSNQQQHSNRYTNVRGINNNHPVNNSAATSCNSLSHQSGSVSPIRARMKASSQQQQQHHHHHNHNSNSHNHHHHQQQSDLGVRASHSYGQMNTMNDINEDANLLNNLHPANYHARDQSSNFGSNQSKSTGKSNLYPASQEASMMNNAASNKQHINSAGYYASPNHSSSAAAHSKQAWQPNSGHKSNQFGAKASHMTSGSVDQGAPPEGASHLGGDQADGEKVVTIISRQQAAPIEAASGDVTDGDANPSEQKENFVNEDSNLRSSRNKQEKCHNSSPTKSQSSSELPGSERHKRSPSKVSTSKLSNLDISCSQGDEIHASNKNPPAETGDGRSVGTKADANKSRLTKEAASKQQAKQPEGQAKRANKEKATTQKPGKQQRVESPKPSSPGDEAGEIDAQKVSDRKQKLPHASVGISDPKLSSEPLIESPNLTSEADSCSPQKASKTSSSEPVAKSRKSQQQQSGDRADGVVESDEQHPPDSTDQVDQYESHANEEVDNDRVSFESRPESPSSLKSPQLSRLTMRTSLSENNIQSLEQAKQKPLSDHNGATLKSVSSSSNRKKVGDIAAAAPTTTTARRRGNSSGKGEQKFKLNAIPQLKILNLNCTSISSSSVQLRWSYNPTLADKYGIHHHHHAKNALMDHFVIESSNSKSVDTNALVSPKIVYQGCALTCRINHLSPEKIYHFKVRRTALLTVTPPAGGAGASDSQCLSGGEHSIVSEILSVTLPSVQQQNSSTGGQQLVATGGNKRGPAGRQQRGGSLDGSTSDYQQSLTNLGQNTMNEDNHQHHHHQRGITSSHNNNSSNNCGNITTKQSSSYHSQSVKFTNLVRQCRGKFFATIGRLIKSSLSSYSDTKFAGLLLVIFTIFAMLLAVFIHLYIVAPVTD